MRHFGKDDIEQVKLLHQKQGLAYELPNLNADTMLVRTVVEKNNLITHAAFLRKTAEAYWLFDPVESKSSRLGWLLALHKEMNSLAKQAGFEDVHCWIPPQIIDKKFDRTMLHLGWTRPEWICYVKEVK